MSPEEFPVNAYKQIGDKCGFSEKTVRSAFSRKPITYAVACRICKAAGVGIECFRIKPDTRGRKKKGPH